MSWWVSLLDEHGVLVYVPRFIEGGTYPVGGTEQAELNITYNYSKWYHQHFMPRSGLQWLHNKVAFDTIGQLERAVKELGTIQDTNYWASTPGNAGYALSLLLKWAKQHPKAIFVVR